MGQYTGDHCDKSCSQTISCQRSAGLNGLDDCCASNVCVNLRAGKDEVHIEALTLATCHLDSSVKRSIAVGVYSCRGVADEMTVADHAQWQHHGTFRVPPRKFTRLALENRRIHIPRRECCGIYLAAGSYSGTFICCTSSFGEFNSCHLQIEDTFTTPQRNLFGIYNFIQKTVRERTFLGSIESLVPAWSMERVLWCAYKDETHAFSHFPKHVLMLVLYLCGNSRWKP